MKQIVLAPSRSTALAYCEVLQWDFRKIFIATEISHLQGLDLREAPVVSLQAGDLEQYALERGAIVYRFSDEPIRKYRTSQRDWQKNFSYELTKSADGKTDF
jgi:hypothetical protein